MKVNSDFIGRREQQSQLELRTFQMSWLVVYLPAEDYFNLHEN